MRYSTAICVFLGALMAHSEIVMALSLESLTTEHHVWQMSEFVLRDAPKGANPYDPEVIAIDVVFTGPSGTAITMPAFWYQEYARASEEGVETLSPKDPPGWRVRFTPAETGTHRYRVTLREGGVDSGLAEGAIDVGARPDDAHGFVRVEPKEKRYFMLDDGTPLPLVGSCACWHYKGGTYDYDAWLAKFRAARMNFTRLWMWNVSFGIEFLAEERLNYNQERAWRLDYVLDLAARSGIYMMLCLDYHGIFQVEPDMWGGNNWWPNHPYNAAQGGPCQTQNDFFTSPDAKSLYRKRLRYLVGRYGAQSALLAWEFFNEINIPLRYLRPADVVAWHGEMGGWLHQQDPYGHLISTSATGYGALPGLWKLDVVDFSQCHLYLDGLTLRQTPVALCANLAERFHRDYAKPMVIGEFGTSSRGPDLDKDPLHRGLQQGLWSGLMGGSAGTAMAWWWETIYAADLYPYWTSLARFIEGTGFGSAGWCPAEVTATSADPAASAGLEALAMTDGNKALVWILDTRYIFPQGATEEAQPVSGVEVALKGLPDGAYEVTWWDTSAGRATETGKATSRDNLLHLTAIPFAADIAARIIPAP